MADTQVGMITNREDCVPDLVEQGILKKVATAKLEDFLGEYHFLGVPWTTLDAIGLQDCCPRPCKGARSTLIALLPRRR